MNYKRNLFKYFTVLITMLFSIPVYAQGNIFDPVVGDISIKALASIFGGLMPVAFAGGQDPMLEAIKMFNAGLLMIAGLLAAYTIVAGTLGTAHDGEMLGKKFSSVWIPIRYSVGTALIMPVVGGGYCVIQSIVMWLVLQGIGLADVVYFQFSGDSMINKAIYVPKSGNNSALQAAENIFDMSVCLQGNQRSIAESPFVLRWTSTYNPTKSSDGLAIRYGDSKWTYKEDNCGLIDLTPYPVKEVTTGEASTYEGRLGTIEGIFADIDVTPLIQSHRMATTVLIAEMDTLAKKAIDTVGEKNERELYAEIDKAAQKYVDTVEETAKQFRDAVDNRKVAAKYGWLVAGFAITSNIDAQNTITQAIRAVPKTKSNSGEGTIDGYFTDARIYRVKAANVLSVSKHGSLAGLNVKVEKDGTRVASPSSIENSLSTVLTKALTTVNINAAKNDTRHPLMIINGVGHQVESFNLAAMGYMTAAAVVLGTISGIFSGGVVGGLSVINSFLIFPFAGAWIVAFFASYYIPLLPAFIWIGGIIGFFLLVIEAVIAAPLWAIMHLHPNGDDMTGKGGNGYMLVLSLLLRPVLMVFGLIAAMIISSVVGELINKVYMEVFTRSAGGGFTGVAGVLGYIFGTAMYCYIMFIVVSMSFTLINKLPDQLLRWMGGNNENLGEFGKSFEQSMGSASKSMAMSAAALTASVKSTSSGLQNSLNNSLNKPPKNGDNGNANGFEEAGEGDSGIKRGGAFNADGSTGEGSLIRGYNSKYPADHNHGNKSETEKEKDKDYFSKSIGRNEVERNQVKNVFNFGESKIGFANTRKLAEDTLQESDGNRDKDFKNFQSKIRNEIAEKE